MEQHLWHILALLCPACCEVFPGFLLRRLSFHDGILEKRRFDELNPYQCYNRRLGTATIAPIRV
jgi:hypothetical protein